MGDPFLMRLYDDESDESVEPERSVPRGSAPTSFVTVDIEHGIGSLGVDRSGGLVSVSLDEKVYRTMRADDVGRCLVAALRAAEQNARDQRGDERMRRWKNMAKGAWS